MRKEEPPIYYLTAEQVKTIVMNYREDGKLSSMEYEIILQNIGTLANYINNYLIMWQSDHTGESVPADIEQMIVERRIRDLISELSPETLAYQMGDYYLSIQCTDTGFDFFIYDKEYHLLDGGIFEAHQESIYRIMGYIVAGTPILDFCTPIAVDYNELMEKSNEARQKSAEIKKEEVLSDEPTPEYVYPPPDPDISISERNEYGYLYDGMLPLTKERAIELFEQDLTVYLLYEDNTEAMVFDREDIEGHDGIFGMESVDWASLQEFEEMKSSENFSVAELEQIVKADGQISLLDPAHTVQKEERFSVVELLKNQSTANKETQKIAPHKGAEMER